VLLQKAVNSEHCTRHRWKLHQDGTQMKFDVSSAMHFVAEACCVKHCFSFSSSYDSAVQLDEDEEDDWPSLQPL
jgi:hypothetical protein